VTSPARQLSVADGVERWTRLVHPSIATSRAADRRHIDFSHASFNPAPLTPVINTSATGKTIPSAARSIASPPLWMLDMQFRRESGVPGRGEQVT